MLNENVVKLLKRGMWDLATCANGEPNVVPVAFKDVTPDGKLVVGDVFLDTTLKNLAASNGKIAISVYDAQSLEGYQVKGTAQYVTEGEVVSTFKAMVEKMFNGAATAKGALIVTAIMKKAREVGICTRESWKRTFAAHWSMVWRFSAGSGTPALSACWPRWGRCGTVNYVRKWATSPTPYWPPR